MQYQIRIDAKSTKMWSCSLKTWKYIKNIEDGLYDCIRDWFCLPIKRYYSVSSSLYFLHFFFHSKIQENPNILTKSKQHPPERSPTNLSDLILFTCPVIVPSQACTHKPSQPSVLSPTYLTAACFSLAAARTA